jgi:hypothetical protein
MTTDQFIQLSLSHQYEFSFYYGELKFGILSRELTSNKIYLIPAARINELNRPGIKQSDVGEPVDIAAIRKWRIANRSQKIIQPKTYPLVNSPTIRKMIIFGAGASYDCGILDEKMKPPLANALFQHHWIGPLAPYYQGAFQLCSDLAHTQDIEAYFQRKWELIVEHYDLNLLSKIINVQFYLHDLFVGISKQCMNPMESNYKCLVNLVDEYSVRTGEHVLFVNFNYDLLLEDALKRSVKYKFDNIDDYVDFTTRKILLFKPHGSCNFIRKLDPSIAKILPSHYEMRSVSTVAEFLYKGNYDLNFLLSKVKGDFEVLGRNELIRNTDMPELVMYLPQLLIPYKSKDSFVMPEKHEIRMENFLSRIDEIFVIGWKGTEAKFQGLLKRELGNKKETITTITRGDNAVREEFARSIPNAVYKNSKSNFSEYIKETISENQSIFNVK